jgi:glycosyltransferase involved in cell wall biosynthesis
VARVAVVLAVRDAEATLEACLRSLVDVHRGEHEVEIVVVDNMSTDRSVEIASRFGEQVRLVREEKRGPAAARNRGMRETGAEVIVFTDSDCIVDPEWIVEIVEPLSDPTVGIVGGKILSVEPSNRIERFGETIHDHRAAIEEFRPPHAKTGSWASRRAALEQAGLFDESLLRGSDAEMAARIHRLGLRLVYRDAAIVRHYNESTFAGLFREGMEHGMGRAKMMRKASGRVSSKSTVRDVVGSTVRLVRGSGAPRFHSLCAVVFSTGKLVGEVLGRS